MTNYKWKNHFRIWVHIRQTSGWNRVSILLDTGASKLFMSNPSTCVCKSLHSLPKLASKTQRIQVGIRIVLVSYSSYQ